MKDQQADIQKAFKMTHKKDQTEVEFNYNGEVNFDNWLFIHRYPLNSHGGTATGKRQAALVTLSDGQMGQLKREHEQLKQLIDQSRADIESAVGGNPDESVEAVRALKEHLINSLTDLNVLNPPSGKNATSVLDLVEFLWLNEQQMCFVRQSTLQSILDICGTRLIPISADTDIRSALKAALNSCSFKHKIAFKAKTKGAITDLENAVGDWFTRLEDKLSGHTEKEMSFLAYETNIETVFLRYMAGASGNAGFEMAEGNVHAYLTGKINAEIDLARCSADAKAYIPSKTGLELTIPPIPAEWQSAPMLKLADAYKSQEEDADARFPYRNTFPRLNFDFDCSFIRAGELNKFAGLEETLKANPKYKLQIVGHTDKVGTDRYNMSLSERRARSVLAYIQNDVEFWDQLYTTLEPVQWGLPVT